MSANRPVNGNRRRNLSVTSNSSSSSCKDNGSLSNNQRNVEAPFRNGVTRSSSRPNSYGAAAIWDCSASTSRGASVYPASRESAQRARTEMENMTPNLSLDHTVLSERDIQQKLHDLQQKKLQYDTIMSQLQHLQSSYQSSAPVPTAPLGKMKRPLLMSNSEPEYVYVNDRTAQLQEAQQSLTQLQELMQNVSLDLECNPFGRHSNNKNINPNSSLNKGYPEFLRNVAPVQGMKKSTTFPRINPGVFRQNNKVSPMANYSAQQCNPSMDFLTPKHYSAPANGSLLDVYRRSNEPSMNSSNEGSADEMEDDLFEGDEEEHFQENQEQIVDADTSNRNGLRVPLDRLNSLENQMERTNSLCELVVVEQRRLAMVLDNLLSAVSNLQTAASRQNNSSGSNMNGHNAATFSSLPMNTLWNDPPGGSELQPLVQTLNQCCHLLTHLQRDLTSVQQSLESMPSSQQQQQDPCRVSTTGDRFDPEMTLNNRVAPGTRTNNYWDNFRSYSRQNLLCSNPKVTTQVTEMLIEPRRSASTTVSTPVVTATVTAATVTSTTATASSTDRNAVAPPSNPVRARTKRKVNKGQSQVQIGVYSPHADNRALAYGMLAVGAHSTAASTTVADSSVLGRNLNPSADYISNDAILSTLVDAPSNKVVKDTSNLKYSGARPKENRMRQEASAAHNVNVAPVPAASVDPQRGIESVIRAALDEHSSRPDFLTNLMQLLEKLDSDSLRQKALNALRGVADGSAELELVKVFDSVVENQREFTPNLLDNFLLSLQQSSEADDSAEGATALPSPRNNYHERFYMIRHSLTPFLFRKLSQIRGQIHDVLINVEQPVSSPVAQVNQPHEDELAEVDQSCQVSNGDGTAPTVRQWQEGEEVSRQLPTSSSSAVNDPDVDSTGLDQVPTRLILSGWSDNCTTAAEDVSRPNGNVVRPKADTGSWFPEENGL